MFWLLGWKDLKRVRGLNIVITMLLTVVLLTVISIVSAVQAKFKRYSELARYLEQKGVYIESDYLTWGTFEDNRLLRDENEIREHMPEVKDVLCVEKLWEPYVEGKELSLAVWCYSGSVLDALQPDMESGRWFGKEDADSDMLKAVVTHNDGSLKTGDVVTVGNGMTAAVQQVEIIGVIRDHESLYYPDVSGGNFSDYRACYYTYDYEAEEHQVLMLLSDRQILDGEKDGRFGTLNYRLENRAGFQKQMTGGTLLTYDEDVPQTVIDRDVELLKQASMINRVHDLSKMNAESWDYILEEMHDYLPVLICIFVFVMIAAVSANAVTVKKQLKNYAVYYICGLPWKNCARISLAVACITSGTAFGMVVCSMLFLKLTGLLADTALTLGLWELTACAVVIGCYILLAWSIPVGIVRNTSAKEIMTENH